MEHAHSGQILGSDLHFYQPPPEAARTRALRSLATIKRCGREQRISCEEDPAKYCFQVLSGAAKSYVVRTNGQRRTGPRCLS